MTKKNEDLVAEARAWEVEGEPFDEVRIMNELATALEAADAQLEKVRAIMAKPREADDFYLSGFANQYEVLRELYDTELPDALEAALSENTAHWSDIAAQINKEKAVKADAFDEGVDAYQASFWEGQAGVVVNPYRTKSGA